jgi:subtilisin-like proprotein convertase family protein
MHLRDSKTFLAAAALCAPALAGDRHKTQALPEQLPAPAFATSSGGGGAQPLIAPACLGTTLTTQAFGTYSPAGAIYDNTTVTQYIDVSGLESYTYDVDVWIYVTHTFVEDLTVLVTSPAGTTVTLARHNGHQQDNVFTGTTFDESSAGYPITLYNFTDNVTAAQLIPFGSLDRFIGEDPNGTWRIDVIDDWGFDSGTFWNSSVYIASLPARSSRTSSRRTFRSSARSRAPCR